MSDQNKEEYILSRRDALKTLAVATGATALSALPGKWETPLIEVGALPAFAQTSPTSYDFTSIVEFGQPGSGVFPQEDRGWIAVVVNNGQVQGVQSASEVETQALPIIIPPIPVNERNFGAPAPGWTIGSTLTLSYTFISETSVFPADGTELVLYGISGSFETRYEATITATVANRVVIFNFGLPAAYSGVFYFSANFIKKTIILTNRVEIDIRYYYAIGIYARFAHYNVPPSNQPLLLSGTLEVFSANTCDMGDGGINGSQMLLSLNYTGGNVADGTTINNFVLFLPSLRLFRFPSAPGIVNGSVISTTDLCMRFASDRHFYYSVWITDADGHNSNSLANFFEAGPGLNSADGD